MKRTAHTVILAVLGVGLAACSSPPSAPAPAPTPATTVTTSTAPPPPLSWGQPGAADGTALTVSQPAAASGGKLAWTLTATNHTGQVLTDITTTVTIDGQQVDGLYTNDDPANTATLVPGQTATYKELAPAPAGAKTVTIEEYVNYGPGNPATDRLFWSGPVGGKST